MDYIAQFRVMIFEVASVALLGGYKWEFLSDCSISWSLPTFAFFSLYQIVFYVLANISYVRHFSIILCF